MLLIVLWRSRFRVFWYSKQFEGKTSQREPWYGTEYIIEKIEDILVQVRLFTVALLIIFLFSVLTSKGGYMLIKSEQSECIEEEVEDPGMPKNLKFVPVITWARFS